MIWIITICTALQCGTYAFSTEDQCQAYAKAQEQNTLSCTPMLLWKKENEHTKNNQSA